MTSSSRALQRERSRALILRIAAEEFEQRGYAAVSISEIASRVQLTKGAVYFHFPSKAALAAAVVDTYLVGWRGLQQVVDDAGSTGLAAIEHILGRVALAYRDDPGARAPLRLMREAALIDEELPRPFSAWIDAVSAYLGQAERAGELRPGLDLDQAAWTIVAATFGAEEVSHELTGRSDLPERVEQLWETLQHGLGVR